MEKWEYLFVKLLRHRGEFRPQKVNGETQVDWKQGPPIHEYCNQLGEEGWKLVDSDGFVELIFMRRKS